MSNAEHSNNNVTVSNIYRQENSGVNSGTFLNGTWLTRQLNKIEGNAPVKLNTIKSTFTLQPGFYIINCNFPAFDVSVHQARLFNVTANKTAKYGNSSSSSGENQSFSSIQYYTGNLTVPTKFKIEHQCKTMKINNGFGVSSGFSSNETSDSFEVYGEVQIIKLS